MEPSVVESFEDAAPGQAPVRGYLHVSTGVARGGIVLTHGAGANCNARLLVALAGAFCNRGLTVLRLDLPFRQLRPHGPPRRGEAERDQEGLRRAVEALGKRTPGRIFLGGHSYGGRQASILAADEPGLVSALLLLSYPLHPPKAPQQLRTGHFAAIRTPALFVSGTRDTFGSTAELAEALRLISALTQLLSIQGAGHELMKAPRSAAGTKNKDAPPKFEDDLPSQIAQAFDVFVARSTKVAISSFAPRTKA